ncbi:DNA-directed RNA polymerase subunit delta [Ammoniphilus sp. CFH 90114]|uniref:DNA-directed RNA polymerase subunit delta n=1 Tax=Ammoniphilus sp. CFH 90114 TaxID=2493665 RepID=UPI0013E99DE9|nr:DNA-directed RNA polymerase subunit delta [Ammoniphilus sp. CFH 90114]
MANQTEQDKWQEVALVDISYEVLDRASKTMNYKEIFKDAANLKGLTDEELMELVPQVYTEMNLDGRFICISAGEWGLKKWYTTEAIEESIEALARAKGIDDDDDDYGFDDEEITDEDFTEIEDYDNPDEDEEVDDEEVEEEEDLEFEEEEDGEFEEEGDDEFADDEEGDDVDEEDDDK